MELKKTLKSQFSKLEILSLFLRYPYLFVNRLSRDYSIPVIMYHKILEHDYPETASPWSVSRASFEKQMEFLHKNDYEPLSVQDYVGYLYEGKSFPERSVLITFDDGYANVRRIAYEVLTDYGFHAVLFVTCNYIDGDDHFPWDREIVSRSNHLSGELRPLTWEEVREMKDLVSVGSHSLSHPRLARLDQDGMLTEVQESKLMIEREIDQEVVAFAYPGGIRRYGCYDDLTRLILSDAGYKVAFNSEIGRNRVKSDPFLQQRIYVEERDSLALFEGKLIGAYDWVRLAQWSFQRLFPDSF